MDFTQIFWWFFILAALQPALSQRFLEFSRKRLIAQVERERRSRLVLLVHHLKNGRRTADHGGRNDD